MIDPQSKFEVDYIAALSREQTIEAYIKWSSLSDIENTLLKKYISNNSKILDLGCGTGRIVRVLKPSKGNYVGVDSSAPMIKAAQELNPNHKFICDDFLKYRFAKESFDVVLLMNNVVDMLNPYQRRIALFKMCKNILNHNGILIYSTHLLNHGGLADYYSEDYHGATVNTFRASFTQHCGEIESLGYLINNAARDYRDESADWIYFAVRKC